MEVFDQGALHPCAYFRLPLSRVLNLSPHYGKVIKYIVAMYIVCYKTHSLDANV